MAYEYTRDWHRIAGALFLAFLVRVDAALVAPQSLVELEKGSALIVHGTASGIVQSGVRFDFSLKINRVIKGDASLSGTSTGVYWISANRSAIDTSGQGGSGIWFLERTGEGWRVAPVVQGTVQFTNVFIPAPSGPISNAYSYGVGDPIEDKLASEICAANEGSVGSDIFSYALLSGGIDELRSSVPNTFYRRMASATAPAQKIVGLSGLIRAGDATALSSAASIASRVAGDPAEGILQLSIREYFRTEDSMSVIALGRIATDSSLPRLLREVAAHALAAIHTRDALPFLASLLDDTELNLRIEAVGGVGAFANGLPIQTRATVTTLAYLQFSSNAPYRTNETVSHFAMGRQAISANETSYTSFWKDWWSKNRATLGY